jgi:hypothetical protein
MEHEDDERACSSSLRRVCHALLIAILRAIEMPSNYSALDLADERA